VSWPSSRSAADVDVRFEGNSLYQGLGTGMVVMDLDGDDYDDILAPVAYEPGTVAIVGTTYIFFGQP